MSLTQGAIRKPVSVTVCVILVLLFGLLGLFRIPIQLTPNIDKAQVTVRTRWPGASPQEVEREIIDVQEEYLKNVEGLENLTSDPDRYVLPVVGSVTGNRRWLEQNLPPSEMQDPEVKAALPTGGEAATDEWVGIFDAGEQAVQLDLREKRESEG